MPDVVLGLSGGVDSTASALLLQKAGYTVHALYLNNTCPRGGGGKGAGYRFCRA